MDRVKEAMMESKIFDDKVEVLLK
jgi:hypothetical protein